MVAAGAPDLNYLRRSAGSALLIDRGGGVERGRADPTRLGDIDGDPVRADVLHLDIGEAAGAAHTERGVDVIAPLGADGGELLGDALEALDLEAEVVDAGPVLAALDTRHHVVLELEDGQVELAVGEEVSAGVRVVDLADLLHPEHVHVELRGGVGIGGGQRDVLDLAHGGLSSGSLLPLALEELAQERGAFLTAYVPAHRCLVIQARVLEE